MKDPGKSVDIQHITDVYLYIVRYKADLCFFKSNILYCNGSNSHT